MERRVLIVEDNEGVALLLKELCVDLGARCVHVRGGSDALAQLGQWMQQGQGLPDLLIADVVLAELDGFQVANAVRALPGGDKLPLVIISGVYKRLPETFEATVRPVFIPKPFDPATIRQTVASILEAADRAEGIERGRFAKTAPSELFTQLCDRRATGLLEVWTQELRRRIWWQNGFIRFAASNVRAETAGGMQVQKGEITQAAFDRAISHARQTKVPLHEALAATRVFPPDKLAEALKLQTSEVALNTLFMAGADWVFQQAEVDKLPDARKHALALVMEAARRQMTPMDARDALLRMGDSLVARSPLLERELFAIRGAWPGETFTALVSSTPVPLVDVIGKAREEDLPFAWALTTSGLLTVTHRAAVRSVAGAPAEDPDKGRQFSAAERQARQFIFSEQERTAPLDDYALLGVSPRASVEEIRAAYLELARRYHTDSYAGLELGSAKAVLSALFQRVNQAVETLSDPKLRADYDIFLERKAQGLPTDVSKILQAEDLFRQAERLLRMNAKGKSHQALELLTEAIALNDSEIEFHVYQAYARFCVKGPSVAAEARKVLAEALEKAPELASAYLFLGLMAREQGNDVEALRQFQKVIELEPSHERALQEMRIIHRRGGQKSAGKSLFGRLFGK